jgi:hypothetical protein
MEAIPRSALQDRTMVTSLLVGSAIPAWDRRLVHALNDALLGVLGGAATWHYDVVNDDGEVYRRLVVNGAEQHGRVLACLLEHGFRAAHGPEGLTIRRPSESVPG